MANFGSERISQLFQSDIRAMTYECVKAGGINLGQGLCELPTPEAVVEGAARALRDKSKNIYSPAEGLASLRQAISRKLARENGVQADPENEIVVTIGATGGYASALMSLLNPGDGILLFEPFYGYHVNAAILAQIEPQFIPMGEGLKLNVEGMKAAVKSNTRAIVLCTPANPSGKMYSASEIDAIADFAVENDLLVITDEMYEYFRYDGREHLSAGSFAKIADRTVTLMGLSKTFSITGWRLGYVAAPEPLCRKIKLANDLFYVCAPTPLQQGVAEGFDIDQKYFSDLRSDFQQRRDSFCEVLEKIGMTPMVPQGAYYVMADISRFGYAGSKEAAMALLKQVGVAAVPGRAFFSGSEGERYLRFCFAVDQEKLNEAMKRLTDFRGEN